MRDEAVAEFVTVPYGEARFDVRVVHADRRTIGLHVQPDQSIVAHVPKNLAPAELQGLVASRARWIARQVRHFQRFQPLPGPKRWLPGETQTYLGRRYRLRVREGGAPSVHLRGRYFEAVVPDRYDATAVQAAMHEWYRSHAMATIRRRMTRLDAPLGRAGVPAASDIRLRMMRTRWGSCSPRGRITINPDLIQAPVDCIDYVLAHERCHLVVPHHGKPFWALLGRVLPDWPRRREKLAGFRR